MFSKKMILTMGMMVGFGTSAMASTLSSIKARIPQEQPIKRISVRQTTEIPALDLEGGENIQVSVPANAKVFIKTFEGKPNDCPNGAFPDPEDMKISTCRQLSAGETIYLWTEVRVFDSWGAPDFIPGEGMDEYNGYQFDPFDFEFSLRHQDPTPDALSKYQIYWKPILISNPYDPKANPVDLGLPDGEIVEQIYYIAFKSDCTTDNSEKSPFCYGYRITQQTFLYFEKESPMSIAQTNPELLTPINVGDDLFIRKFKNEVLKISLIKK